MKQRFEQIAKDNNWHFEYGRKDFLNLEVIPTNQEQEFYFFLDPIEETTIFDEFSNEESTTFSGRLLLLIKSDFDRVYDSQSQNASQEGKYEMYIKRCKEELRKIPQDFTCDDMYIKQWKIYEVINQYDDNFDGVLVNYIIEKH